MLSRAQNSSKNIIKEHFTTTFKFILIYRVSPWWNIFLCDTCTLLLLPFLHWLWLFQAHPIDKWEQYQGHLSSTVAGLTHGYCVTKRRHVWAMCSSTVQLGQEMARLQDKVTLISCRTDACGQKAGATTQEDHSTTKRYHTEIIDVQNRR